MHLTEEGLQLLELATDLLERADSVRQKVGKIKAAIQGHYRVGASHFLAVNVLTPILSDMQKHSPGLTVEMHSQPTWALVDSMLAGRIDFGIGFSPVPHPQFDYIEVFRGHSVVMAKKNHPIFRHDEKEAYKFLPDYPATMHIATEKVFMAKHHPFFKTANLERNIKFSFDSDYVALENLKHSDHWCLMLDIVAAEFSKQLRQIEIPRQSGSEYTIQIFKLKSRKADAAMMETFKQIEAVLKKTAEKMTSE